MGFSHFHEFGIISGLDITMSNRYCERMWFRATAVLYLFYIDFFPTNHDLQDGNNIYLIFYF